MHTSGAREPTPFPSPFKGPHRWNSSCQECQEWSGDPAHNVNIYSNLVPSIKDLGHSRPLHPLAHSPLSPSPIIYGESQTHNGSHNNNMGLQRNIRLYIQPILTKQKPTNQQKSKTQKILIKKGVEEDEFNQGSVEEVFVDKGEALVVRCNINNAMITGFTMFSTQDVLFKGRFATSSQIVEAMKMLLKITW